RDSNHASWQWHYAALRLQGVLGLVTWYIGAAWFLEQREITTDTLALAIADVTPHYACVAGSARGPFCSWLEVARLLGISYNVFAVTAPPNAVGVTASPLGFVVSVGLLWPLPTLVETAVITAVNAGRLRSKALAALHNHVVVAVLWFAALWLMCAAPVR
ncbi:hypothetical protein PINS_up002016, partial [Pythium insidiosum]